MVKNEERLVGLDLFRIGLAFLVFLFHSSMMGCTYSFLTQFVQMGAVAMTAFFSLSGFALYYVYNKIEITELAEIKNFYIKRLISIYPNYLITAILFITLFSTTPIKQELLLVPIEIMGLQTVFSSLFGYSHNGGTWFISCIILCYLSFPYVLNVTKQQGNKSKFILIALCVFILLYSTKIVRVFKIADIYSNPFFRFLEFYIGILLASFIEYIQRKEHIRKFIANKFVALLLIISMITCITIAVKRGYHVNNYMKYSYFVLPVLLILLPSLALIKFHYFNNNLIFYLSNISYAFFLGQFFCFNVVKKYMATIQENHVMVFIVSFFICITYSILLYHFVQIPCKKILTNFFFKSKQKS